MPTHLHFNEKRPRKKIINKKYSGANRGLEVRSLETAFTTKMVVIPFRNIS